jgi:hypothetical protein
MILNSESVQLIRANAARLASCVRNKEELTDFATAGSFEQVFAAIEMLLTNTEMYFDDEILLQLDAQNWKSFKAVLLVYTLNLLNKHSASHRDNAQGYRTNDPSRDLYGATSHP